jgi:REP element-mobilizing transposase RayT
MARPLRIEFEGALYHVMARGNARGEIFLDDHDRKAFIDNLGRVCARFDWRVWAWCLMSNHYHLLIETLRPALSKGMREVNGVYTQGFNRRHGRVGHVLQGRYKAVLVRKDTHLLELSRYVVLNPVNAGMVEAAGDWQWSSYRAVMGKSSAPGWLVVAETLELFHNQRGPARRAYARFVADGVEADDPYDQMPRPGFLGEESFIEEVLDQSAGKPISAEVPKRLRPALSLEQIEKQAGERNRAIADAYSTGAYTLTEIARYFGIHLSTASRIARGVAGARNKT